MERLPNLPWKRMLDFLLQLQESDGTASYYRTIMRELPKLVPVDVGVSCLSLQEGRPRCLAFEDGPAIMRQFNDYFWKLMPYSPEKVLDMPKHDYRKWESSEYVADFIRPNRIWHKVSTPSLAFSVSLYRSRRDVPFSEFEAAIVGALAPHLESLYKLLRARPTPDLRWACAFEIRHRHLTRREIEVLELVQERLTNAEIGGQLGISPRTVEKHLANMYEKTGTSDRWALLAQLSQSN